MATLFAKTKKFTAAVELMNGCDTGKFPQLLRRLVSKLHIRTTSTVFTEDEETALQGLLSLSAGDLNTVLDAAMYVFESAAYAAVKPENLAAQLADAGLAAAVVEAFVLVWSNDGAGLINRLKERPLGANKALTNIDWAMHVNMSQSSLGALQDVSAVMELGFLENATSLNETAVDERVQLEFSYDQLYGVFQEVERLQSQLDTLSHK